MTRRRRRKTGGEKSQNLSTSSEVSPEPKRSKMADAGGPLSSTPVPLQTKRSKKEIKEIQLDTVQLKANNDRLQDQLTVTQRELSNTQEELHDLQQYSRRNNIEIHGIPQRNGEDTNDIVVRVAAAVGVDITPSDIDISHRLPSRQNQTQQRHQTPAIIVKFVRRSVRNSIYYARKNLRGQTPNQIRVGDNNTNNIYINENLTPTMKRLFHQVNERRKQLKWRFIWTSNGKIFTRKDETSEVISVSSAKAVNRIN
ncbi:uncharacterized protein [Ptychodera flava]|uniref:uncharacterized protein n=1 Tax=Ptychodera flava TaxID=63121 RepID=UPI003969FB19